MRWSKAFQMVFIKSTLLIALLCLAFNESGEGIQKDWMIHAKSYVEADRLIALHGTEGKSTFLEDLKRRDETVKRFKESTPPTIQEIEELVGSRNTEEQVIAGIAILITGNYSIPIIEKLVNNLKSQGPFELKRYSALALKKVSQKDLKPYEETILQAIEQETNEPALIEEMLYLLPLDPEKSARVLLNLLLHRNSDQVKIFSYVKLHKLGPEYKQRALEELKQIGDKETLELINKMDQPVPLMKEGEDK